jgi:integrase
MKGHIRARGDSWSIVLDLGRDPATGRRRQKWYTVAGTKKDAQRELTRLLREIDTGSFVEPSKTTLGKYLAEWLDSYARTAVAPKTFERYREIIGCHLGPALGKHILSQLRPLHIQAYYSLALRSGRRPARGRSDAPSGLSARTVLHHHRVLRQALAQAIKWQLLVRNPADSVEPPRPVPVEMHTLDEAQIAKLLDFASGNPLLRLAILLAVTTGLRRGEIMALRWADLDLDAGSLAVRQSLEETKAGLAFKAPKTLKGRRTVALPALAIEGLRRHRAEQARVRLHLGPGYADNDLVCCHADGRPIHPQTITHAFIKLIDQHKSELPRVSFHSCRHSHATILLRKGVHPKIVSERLGHATTGITLDIYSQVMPGMQEEAALKVDIALRTAIDGAA